MYARRRESWRAIPTRAVEHTLVVHGDVTAPDRDGPELVIGAQVGHQRVLFLPARPGRSMGAHRLTMAAGEELHASVVDGGVIERQPTGCGPAVVGVDPVRLILVPGEHGVLTAGLFREQLVEVERHSLTAELLGNRLTDPFEHVALPLAGGTCAATSR